MQTDVKLTPKQQRLFRLCAEGFSQTDAAREVSYSKVHATRLVRSEVGRAEIARLKAQIEEQFLTELPDLIELSLAALREQLNSSLAAHRWQAAQFVLKHLSKPFIKTNGTAQDGGNVIEILNTEGMEASNESSNQNT